jgi:hypothetical protein
MQPAALQRVVVSNCDEIVVRSNLVLLEDDDHVVALQVAFESQILKPVFHLIGYRLWV